MKDFQSFLNQVKQWGNEQPSIKAVFLVGSYARGEAREDSDIDFVILTENPQKYTDDAAFTQSFGAVEKVEKEDWGRVTSLRVWYRESFEVEFGFSTPDWITEEPLDLGTLRVISDGAKIIFDRLGDLEQRIAIPKGL